MQLLIICSSAAGAYRQPFNGMARCSDGLRTAGPATMVAERDHNSEHMFFAVRFVNSTGADVQQDQDPIHRDSSAD